MIGTLNPLSDPLSFATEQRFEPVPEGEEHNTDVWRLAVFMSPLDVHVNRAPAAGVVERIEHRTGKWGYAVDRFVRLTPKKANTTSAPRSVHKLENGHRIELVQISGALARTVLPYVFNGDAVRRGQRIGMIRLGSRVDLRAPAEAYTSSIITAEDAQEEHPKGMHVMAGSSVVFRSTLEENE